MSGPGGDETLAEWRAHARAILIRAERVHGVSGLSSVLVYKRLLNLIPMAEVERARVGEPIFDGREREDENALRAEAAQVLHAYTRIKALDMARAGRSPAPPEVAPVPPTVAVAAVTIEPHLPAARGGSLVDPLWAGAPRAYPGAPPPGVVVSAPIVTPAKPQRRDLTSDEGIARIQHRQEIALTRLFAPPPLREKATDAEARAGWSARLELRDTLSMVTSALTGLPRFVKALALTSGEFRAEALGSNLRSGVTRTRVPASAEGYRWLAEGLEEELGDDLAKLNLPGFSLDHATVFRIDATGEGQRLLGLEITPERAYRVLVPPALSVEAFPATEVRNLGGGWHVIELTGSASDTAEVKSRLSALGLIPGEAGLEAELCGIAAREYRIGRSGDRYPCFDPEDRPIVRVSASTVESCLFLASTEAQLRFELPVGEDSLVELGPLAPGCYVLDVLTADLQQPSVRLMFEVASVPARVCEAWVRVTMGDEILRVEDAASRERDLATLTVAPDAPPSLRIVAPPLWRIGVRWEGARSQAFPPIYADRAGDVDVSGLLLRTEVNRATELLGDLVLDFGDLGTATLRHHRLPDEPSLRARFGALLAQRASALESDLDFPLLRAVWVDPVCEALGYGIRDLDQEAALPGEEASATPHGFLGLALVKTVRAGARVTTVRPSALVLVRRGADLRHNVEGSARGFAARLCERHGLTRAVLTDGIRWAHWERGKQFAQSPVDVRHALGEAEEAPFSDFLARFHACSFD